MYTAQFIKKEFRPTENRVVYHFDCSDGAQIIRASFPVALYTTKEQVIQLVAERIKEYESADVILPSFVEGETVDLSGIKVGRTAEEQEYREWIAKLNRLERVKKLVSMGVLTGSEQGVVNLETAVKTGFKASFLTLI